MSPLSPFICNAAEFIFRKDSDAKISALNAGLWHGLCCTKMALESPVPSGA